MRLVLIVPRFPRLSETFIVNKYAGLVDAGWDVHIVCGELSEEWSSFPALADRPDLRWRVHTQWPHTPRWIAIVLWLPAFLSTMVRAPRATGRYWRTAWKHHRWGAFKRFYLDAAVIALSPDVLHFEFGTVAVGRTYLKQALGCRLSVSFRGYDLNYIGLQQPDYYGRVWEEVDAVHVLGKDLWQRALRRGCPPDKPHVMIPPAIDTAYFYPDKTAGRFGSISPERSLRILSVGRLEWKKGYEYALSAVRLLAERDIPCEYRIIGGGDYLEPLAFLRHKMGLEDTVQFLGSQPHSVVMAEMNQADIFLHAAVSEGFCNAALEAQAMQLPVVASDADGLSENVADGLTGFVVPRRDPGALADKLALLAEDEALRQKMGIAGRQRVETCFQLPDQIAAFDRYYRELVADHAR